MIKRIKSEPVAFFGSLQVVLLAVFTLAALFDWWTWSEDQQAGVLALWAAVTAFLTYLIRGSVTPTNSLPPS